MNAPLGFTLIAISIWVVGQWRMRRRWKGVDIARKVIFTLAMALFILVATSHASTYDLPLVGIFVALAIALQVFALRTN